MLFENVLKEGINIACKGGVFCCAIDLDFQLTESWGESKNDSMGEVACPSSQFRALKKTSALQAIFRVNKAGGTMP